MKNILLGKRTKSQRVVALLFTVVFIMLSSVTVFATPVDYTAAYDATQNNKYLTDVYGDLSTVTSTTGPQEIKNIINNTAYTTGDTSPYGSLPTQLNAEGVAAMDALAKRAYDTQSMKVKIANMGTDFDVSADTKGAVDILMGFQPLIRLVIGLAAVAVSVGMTLFTSLDLLYINMPVFRNATEEMKQSGKGIMVGQDKNGDAKLKWVTQDAQFAVTKATMESGKNPNLIYLGKRIISFVLVAIVIYILLTGNITLITNIAIRWVGGIIDALGGLAD